MRLVCVQGWAEIQGQSFPGNEGGLPSRDCQTGRRQSVVSSSKVVSSKVVAEC